MKIKIKGKVYDSAKVPKYHNLINKLRIIMNDNKNLKYFKFHGVYRGNQIGIVVEGTDSLGVRDFTEFYSIHDIDYYFNKINKRLERK